MPTIPPEQMERWNADGFLKIERFFPVTEVALLRQAVEDIEGAESQTGGIMHHFEETPAGVQPSRSENFIPHHPQMQALLTRGRVLEAVAALLDQPAVVYKEKINYKYPGGGSYRAHQDAPAYEFVSRHVTCLIALDPATTESGCLYFSPGLHQQGLIALDESGCIGPEAAARMQWVPVPTRPGDILFFSSYVPHKSGPNRTAQPRRVVYVTYNALAEGDFRERYYADKRQALARQAAQGADKAGMISKIGHFQGKTIQL